MLTAIPERTTKVRTRRRGSAFTRERILTASMQLFSREGYPRTTVREIACQAGITDAAIYYHFATKEELLREILNTSLQSDNWAEQQPSCEGVRELVDEAVDEAARLIETNHRLLRIVFRESLAGDPVATRRYRQLIDDWESRLSARLLPFESAGALAPGEAGPVARQIMHIIIMAFEDMLLLRPDPSMQHAERLLRALMLISRHIDRVLSPICGSRALPGGIAVAADSRKRVS